MAHELTPRAALAHLLTGAAAGIQAAIDAERKAAMDRETGYVDSPCTDCGQHDAVFGPRCRECYIVYVDALSTEGHELKADCECDICTNAAWCDWCGDTPATTDRRGLPICAACDAKQDEREARNPPVRSWERD